jgi:hypothetical protein
MLLFAMDSSFRWNDEIQLVQGVLCAFCIICFLCGPQALHPPPARTAPHRIFPDNR